MHPEPREAGEARVRGAVVAQEPGRLQHAGPVDPVGLEDVLADQVVDVRPVPPEPVAARVAEGGHVVEERVEPDVRHEPVVERQRDAPLEPALRAADRQVLERLAEESQELVPEALGLDDVGVTLQVATQPVLVRRHPEEVVLLLDVGQRGLVVGALPVDDLLVRVEALAPEAVLPPVLAEVDLALLEEPLQDALDHARVPRLGRPDEVVVGDSERRPLFLERLRIAVGEGLGRLPGLRGCLGDLVAVLVGARQEEDVGAREPAVAGHRVGHDGRVGVTEVGRPVDVVDRRREVEQAVRGAA